MYEMVGQYGDGDGPCGDGGQRMERKGRGKSRLEESCEGSQNPRRAVVLLLLLMMMMINLLKPSGNFTYDQV
jgi:hypothetical protein